MHQGKPYGLHIIGGKLTDRDEAFVSVTAKRFSNLKDLSSIDSSRIVYDLPDGGYVVIQDMGGNFRVIAHKPTYGEQFASNGLAKTDIPMLFSGAVVGYPLLKLGDGLPLNLTKQTQRRIFNYDIIKQAPSNVRLLKFACKYNPIFFEFKPENEVDGLIYTQYIEQKPTWYSGAMAEVIQIVGGYGKQELDKLPEDDVERAKMAIPDKYMKGIVDKLKNQRLPAYTGLPNKDGQFQYDYRFLETNLVSFDSDNKPWLIKIDRSGVWAMPLPIVPATSTDEFREYMIEVNDTEILAILDRFGALPSGESFPLSVSAFEAWRRAGVIIKICDTSDFYTHDGYSTAMGWSSNLLGTEAINTCYDYDEISQLVTSFTYKAKLRLQPAVNSGWLDVKNNKPTTEDQGFINRYLTFIYELITDNTPKNLAIKYKINRTSLSDLADRARRTLSESEVDYWGDLTLEPIANHIGKISKINQGPYFGGAEIKVPEPVYFKGCVSVPISRANRNDYLGAQDTIVLAYYMGDSLKVARSFNDNRVHKYQEETDFEEHMYAGKWFKRRLLGEAKLSGTIYLSDIDDRVLTATTEVNTDVLGTDLGFSGAHLQMDFYLYRTGDLFRNRYYTTLTNKRTDYGKSVSLAATIPYFSRNVLLYAKTESAVRVEKEDSLNLGTARDPWSYRIWSDNETLPMFGRLEVQNGLPYPVDGQPVYAEIQNYTRDDTGGWADDGPWIPALPYDVTSLLYNYGSTIWAFQVFPPPPPVNEYKTVVSDNPVPKYTLSCHIFNSIQKVRDDEHSEQYYTWSPDIRGTVFYVDACQVVFGSKRYANISEKTETGNRKQWGESLLVDNKSAHHFIGVINE